MDVCGKIPRWKFHRIPLAVHFRTSTCDPSLFRVSFHFDESFTMDYNGIIASRQCTFASSQSTCWNCLLHMTDLVEQRKRRNRELSLINNTKRAHQQCFVVHLLDAFGCSVNFDSMQRFSAAGCQFFPVLSVLHRPSQTWLVQPQQHARGTKCNKNTTADALLAILAAHARTPFEVFVQKGGRAATCFRRIKWIEIGGAKVTEDELEQVGAAVYGALAAMWEDCADLNDIEGRREAVWLQAAHASERTLQTIRDIAAIAAGTALQESAAQQQAAGGAAEADSGGAAWTSETESSSLAENAEWGVGEAEAAQCADVQHGWCGEAAGIPTMMWPMCAYAMECVDMRNCAVYNPVYVINQYEYTFYDNQYMQ